MTVTTTSSPNANAVAALYASAYIMSVRQALAYSQSPIVYVPPQGVMGVGNRGSSLKIPLFLDLARGSSLSETADVTPVQLSAFQATITPELYGQAVQLSQKLSLMSFTDVEAAAVEAIGRSAAAKREEVARKAAIGGANVFFGGDATTRAGCSTAATADTITFNNFVQASLMLESAGTPKIPGGGNGYVAVISGPTEADLVASSAIILAAEYGSNEALLTGEIGTHLTGTRLIRSIFAKQYLGAGTSMGGMNPNGVYAAVAAGDTSFGTTAAPSTLSVGDFLFIGSTAESTGNDDVADAEVVRVLSTTSSSGAAIGIIGAGVNGGFMYAHSSGALVTCNASVQGTVFLGAESLAMVYSNEDGLGPEGMIILPEVTGILHQFNNVGWKGFWGFGIVSENRVARVEAATNFHVIGH